MASPCVITFDGKKYAYDKWVELLHNGKLEDFVTTGLIEIKPYEGPKVKAEGKPGEAKGKQEPAEAGRPSTPDEVLQKNSDGTYTIRNKSDLQNFFQSIIGFGPQQSMLAADLFERRAEGWAAATGRTTDEFYQRYLFKDYVKAEKQELGQAVVNGQVVQTRALPNQLEIVNGFYSPIEKNLMEYGKDKIKAKDWLNVVGKGDEAVFTGVRAFLEGKDPNAMVSKQEILDYMKDNRISVVEVVKGESAASEMKRIEQKFKENGYKIYQDNYGDVLIEDLQGNPISPFELPTNELAALRINYIELVEEGDKSDLADTKYSQKQLEGEKENYKEVLVTLPSDKKTVFLRTGGTIEFEKNQFGGAYVVRRNGKELYRTLTESDAINKLPKPTEAETKFGADFKSSHFEEPNILVHLRMNTRTDADGKKVLFLEEVQSDWGQTGKKEGFANVTKLPEGYRVDEPTKFSDWTVVEPSGIDGNVQSTTIGQGKTREEAIQRALDNLNRRKTQAAPFVMDTNAWTKLGLKVALKEAVAQGVDKIAWTTGEQQNDRYDLSKQVDEIIYTKNNDNTFDLYAIKNGQTVSQNFNKTIKEIESIAGKDIADKILNEEGVDVKGTTNKSLKGDNLKVGGKGMKGFYGSMEEGTKGIVGGVAEKVFGQELKTTTIKQGEVSPIYNWTEDSDGIQKVEFNGKEYEFKTDDEAKEFIRKEIKDKVSIQPSIDITPELKAQVAEGISLFQQQEEPTSERYFAEKEERLKNALENAKKKLDAKKRQIAKRIKTEGQMNLFPSEKENPLLAEFNSSPDTIVGILAPYEADIKRIEYEILDNQKALQDFRAGQASQYSLDFGELFKRQQGDTGYRGSWSRTADSQVRTLSFTQKADSTTQVHELLGHDYLDEIAAMANSGSQIHRNMLAASILEFLRYNKNKYSFDTVMEAISKFNPADRGSVPANLLPIAVEFHEFFAEAAEEFMRDPDGYEAKHKSNQGQAWVAMLMQFKEYLVNIANSLMRNGFVLSEPMRQVFRNAFGPMVDIAINEAEKNIQQANADAIQEIYPTDTDVKVDGTDLFQAEVMHGTPYRFNKELLVRNEKTGEQKYIVGTPDAFPSVPAGFSIVKEFPNGRFRTEFMGKGEGAQAFGWGMYFTDLESIARDYAEKLGRGVLVDGKEFSEYMANENVDLRSFAMFPSLENAKNKNEALKALDDVIKRVESKIDEFEQDIQAEESWRERGSLITQKESLEKSLQSAYDVYNAIFRAKEYRQNEKVVYKATLHKGKTPDQYTWLVWDKFISNEQKEQIAKGISDLTETEKQIISKYFTDKGNLKSVFLGQEYKKILPKYELSLLKNRLLSDKSKIKGSEIYNQIERYFGGFNSRLSDNKSENSKQASLFLLENGIDGIKYPAESIARGATSDTARGFNYVVFDENAVTIEEVELFQRTSALYQQIPPAQEEKIAGKFMPLVAYYYRSLKADEFNIMTLLNAYVDAMKDLTDEQKEIVKTVLAGREQQIKGMYKPVTGDYFRRTGQQIKRSPDYTEEIKTLIRGEMGEGVTVSLNDQVKKAQELIDNPNNSMADVKEALVNTNPGEYPNWIPIAQAYVFKMQRENAMLRRMRTPEATAAAERNLKDINDVLERIMEESSKRGRLLNELKVFSMLDPYTRVWRMRSEFKKLAGQELAKARKKVAKLFDVLKEEREIAASMINDLFGKDKSIKELEDKIIGLENKLKEAQDAMSKKSQGNATGGGLKKVTAAQKAKNFQNAAKKAIAEAKARAAQGLGELYQPNVRTGIDDLFFVALQPDKDSGKSQFFDLKEVFDAINDILVQGGSGVTLETAAEKYRLMRDEHIRDGEDASHYLDDIALEEAKQNLYEYSEEKVASIKQQIELAKAELENKKREAKEKKKLKDDLNKAILELTNVKAIKDAMIALKEDMKNVAFEEDSTIDSIKDQVMDIIRDRAEKSNLPPSVVSQVMDEVDKKFDEYRANVWNGVSESIAKTIKERARKALGATASREDTLFSEFVRLLGEKSSELYRKQFAEEAERRGVKGKAKTAFDSLEFAVRALNDENGMQLWDEAKNATIDAIMQDDRLSSADKQVALAMLDNFLNNIYDSVLPQTDRMKIVRQAMKDAGLLTGTQSVAWQAIWERSKGDMAVAREIVKEKITQYLPNQSMDNVSNKIIDLLMDKYDSYIEERRVKLVENQIKAMETGIAKRMSNTRTQKAKRRSFAEKLVRLVNSGALTDPKNMTAEQARDIAADYFGLNKYPSKAEWEVAFRLAQDVADAPEGHEKDLATEKMGAWVEYHRPGYGWLVMASASISNMLGRITTLLKNSTGVFETITKGTSMALRDFVLNPKSGIDLNYVKIALKSLGQGDFLDILAEGGVNQGDRLATTIDPQGLPRVRTLEYVRPSNLYMRGLKALRYIGRIMSATDAVNQRAVSEMVYYDMAKQLAKKGDKKVSQKELRKRLYQAMYNMKRDEAMNLAGQDFDAMGLAGGVSKYRMKRQAFQRIRQARAEKVGKEADEALQEISTRSALEEAFKSPMIENLGLATGLGELLLIAARGLNTSMKALAKHVYPSDSSAQARFEARGKGILGAVRMQYLPFMTGVFNVMEKTLDKIPPYALAKAAKDAIVAGLKYRSLKEKEAAAPTGITPLDDLEVMYYTNRAMEHVIRAAVITGITAAVAVLIGGGDDEDEEERGFRITGSRAGYQRGMDARKNVIPENSIIFSNGSSMSLGYFGPYGMALAILANVKQQRKIARKKSEREGLSEGMKDFYDVYMKSLGVFLEMGMLEGINRLERNVRGYLGGSMDAGDAFLTTVLNAAVNAGIPYVGTSQQIAEAVREVQGKAVTPITNTEYVLRYLGVPSLLVEGKPALDWRGRNVPPSIRNSAGIGALIPTSYQRPIKMDAIDKFLDQNLVSIEWKSRSDKDVTILKNYERKVMDPLMKYAYRAGVSKAWDYSINELYSNMDKRYDNLTPTEQEEMFIDDVVAEDMRSIHNMLETYAGNYTVSVYGLSEDYDKNEESMRDAQVRIANIFEKYGYSSKSEKVEGSAKKLAQDVVGDLQYNIDMEMTR